MSFLRDALAAALESAENDLPEDVTPEENLSEALMETEDAAQEAEEAEEVVEELEDAADSMESIVAALETHVAEGGMSPQTATTHNVAMQNVLRKLPLDATRFTVSSESFGGTEDRLVASQEALEGAKALLNKIWEGIKNAWSKAWNAVKTFFATIGKSAKALKAAAADLKKKADAASGFSLKEGVSQIEIPAALLVGSTVTGEVSGNLNKVVQKGDSLGGLTKTAVSKLTMISNQLSTGNGNTFEIAAEVAKLTASASADESMPGTGKLSGKQQASVPAVKEAVNIAEAVRKIAENLDTYSNKEFKSMESAINSALKAAEAKVKRADEKEAEAMKKQINDLNKVGTDLRKLATSFNSYAAKTAKVAIGYGHRIVKQYGEKKESK